ncbi:unnamed protein product [Urochloa humidicola]
MGRGPGQWRYGMELGCRIWGGAADGSSRPVGSAAVSPPTVSHTSGKEHGRSMFGFTTCIFKKGYVFRASAARTTLLEVLKHSYRTKAIIWIVGVIVYILLCSVLPFWAEEEQGIFNDILRGQVEFTSDPLPCISQGTKDLFRKMLNPNPKHWISAYVILNHPWIKEEGKVLDTTLDNVVLSWLKKLRACIRWYMELEDGYLVEQKKLCGAMDAENTRHTELGLPLIGWRYWSGMSSLLI